MAQHIGPDNGRFFQKHRPFHTINDLVCSLHLALCPRFRSICQTCHIAFRMTLLRYPALSPDLFRLVLKIRVCLPQPLSRLHNMLHRFLIDLPADLRDQLISQTVSGILIFPVGGILTISDMPFFQIFQDLLLFQAQKRPDDLSTFCRHSTQSLQSTAPEQVIENGFCLIFLMVGHGNLRRTAACRLQGFTPAAITQAVFLACPVFGILPQDLIPHIPSGFLQRQSPLRCQAPHLSPFHHTVNS